MEDNPQSDPLTMLPSDLLAIVEGRRQIAEGDVHDFDEVIEEVEAIVRSA